MVTIAASRQIMELHGKNLIAGEVSAEGTTHFTGVDPVTSEALEPQFTEATEDEVGRALKAAEAAFEIYREESPERVALFLEQIAESILALGDALIERAQAETALPKQRLIGERARTINQLKMFAELLREGSWVEASIDRAQPARKPAPKPDLRKMLIPLGPVAVFGASNFPFAYSVAGGDTASALAARNPVIVKAHPGHPGASEMVAQAVQKAVENMGMPAGVFSLLQGPGHELSLQLARHPALKAIGFTGSLAGGRALFDAAAGRGEPIPVYAEMGSTNPVFLLPGALQNNAAGIAEAFVQSVTLGVGQFCTNPGLVFGLENPSLKELVERAGQLISAAPPSAMLYKSISERFEHGIERARSVKGLSVAGKSATAPQAGEGAPILLTTSAATFLNDPTLKEEIFGPSSIIVSASSPAELEQIARTLPGQLTASVHGTAEELTKYQKLISILQTKAGRLVFNGFPTGVEVCPSMNHGGPYPATTEVHFTSVGTAAIKRFARPVCFQNFPEPALPPELQNKNTRRIWRVVDGNLTKDDLT